MMLRLLLFSFIAWAAVGCNAGKNRTNIELIQDMMDQENVKAQDHDKYAGDKGYMRTPPVGTVAQGHRPMPEAVLNDPIAAGQQLRNPLAGNFSAEILSLGKAHYETYCMVCHGSKGSAVQGELPGDGSVIYAMTVKPPTLLSSKVREYPDGRIYHVIARGQGVMGAYATQIRDEKARWAVVNYVRSLQRAQGGN